MAAFPRYAVADVRALSLRTGIGLEQQADRLRRERIHDMALAMRMAGTSAADFSSALDELEID